MCHVIRLERFGIDENRFWYIGSRLEGEKKNIFIQNLREFSKIPSVVAMTSSLLHIMDEVEWGLIPKAAGNDAVISIMRGLPELVGFLECPVFDGIINKKQTIFENWICLLSWYMKNCYNMVS